MFTGAAVGALRVLPSATLEGIVLLLRRYVSAARTVVLTRLPKPLVNDLFLEVREDVAWDSWSVAAGLRSRGRSTHTRWHRYPDQGAH